MPVARNAGVGLYYEVDESDVHDAPVLFVGDAPYGAWQWGWQHAAVAGPFETIVADIRGSGRSDAPAGPYAVGDLVADAQAVLADHGASSAHVVGCGLGGMVALELARVSSRPRTVTLLGTAAHGDGLDLGPVYADPDDPDGLASSLAAVLSREFLDAHPDAVERIVEWRAAEDADAEAFAAQRAAVEAYDGRDSLYEITTPALVVHGGDDHVWPPVRGEALADGLPRGSYVELDGAGHLVGVERSRVVNDHLWDHLAPTSERP
jgi:pimeloyl-ACP methyl ester carboxylesterase